MLGSKFEVTNWNTSPKPSDSAPTPTNITNETSEPLSESPHPDLPTKYQITNNYNDFDNQNFQSKIEEKFELLKTDYITNKKYQRAQDNHFNFNPNAHYQKFKFDQLKNSNELNIKLKSKPIDQHLLKNLFNHNYFQKMTSLDLSLNSIDTVLANSFKINNANSSSLNKLVELNLSHCSITNLENDCFLNLKNLKILLLNNNLISEIHKQTFHSLQSLEKLSLRKNQLQKIEKSSFKDLENLLHLDLANNKLENFPENLFLKMKALKFIDLSCNYNLKVPETYCNDFYVNGTSSSSDITGVKSKVKSSHSVSGLNYAQHGNPLSNSSHDLYSVGILQNTSGSTTNTIGSGTQMNMTRQRSNPQMRERKAQIKSTNKHSKQNLNPNSDGDKMSNSEDQYFGLKKDLFKDKSQNLEIKIYQTKLTKLNLKPMTFGFRGKILVNK